MKMTLIAAATAACLAMPWTGARATELRLSTLADASISLEDADNQLNPYDYGANPAYLLLDFEEPWIRFLFGIEEERGDLKRFYDPHLTNDLYAGFEGIKKLGDRHVARGSVTYERLRRRETAYNLEIDGYNDPFYLVDETIGDFTYYGPSIHVDYGLRLRDDLHIGAGFDYDIGTDLKQEYTRPEIVHNNFRGNLGLLWSPRDRWMFGLVARPIRTQNRTSFAKTDEGFDNIFYSWYGEGIVEVRASSSFSIREVLKGVDVGLQQYYMGERFRFALLADYTLEQLKLQYNATRRDPKGFWQDETWDVKARARWYVESMPLVLGVEGRLMKQDGWARRPEYDDILLFENPATLESVGAGLTYRIEPLRLLTSVEYVMNRWDIDAFDYGANDFRSAEIVQNIGRLALEYRVLNIYSVRGGFEVIDYPVDRWLQLPANMDRYRFTGGFGYATGRWEIDTQFLYSSYMHDDYDSNRTGLSGIVWFTRFVD